MNLRETLMPGRAAVPQVSREDLARRSAALRSALESGGSTFDDAERQAAEATLAKVEQRTAIAGTRTVVALAGATGSGKSSLFNFLVGEPISRIGARRPTTSRSVAGIWGSEPSAELLDWLGISQRHHVTAAGPPAEHLDGLVLLDLPDFDSRVVEHRDEADRVLKLVDAFVWVTDPQKYADAVLHDDYVRTMAAHAEVTIAVLNQIDRLDPKSAEACRQDQTRLLQRDGLSAVTVLGTSSVTQAGIGELVGALAEVVQRHNALEQRLLADVTQHAAQLSEHVGTNPVSVPERPDVETIRALERACGVPVLLDAVERDYVRHARHRTGWPLVTWADKQRPSSLSRFGLQDVVRDEDVKGLNRSQARAATGRSSLPAATPAARARVEAASRRVGRDASAGLPPDWAEEVQAAASPDQSDLIDALDQAVVRAPIAVERPAWWALVNLVQWLLVAVAIVGLGWTLLMGSLGAPKVGPIPVPPLLLIGGLLLGWLIAALCSRIAKRAARRRRVAVHKAIRPAVIAVADEHLYDPVRAVIDRHEATRRALADARA
ncbi:GTPase [Dermacoccaceae bacterium W4C1]